MQAELLTCVYTHMQTSIHTSTDVCCMPIAICYSVRVDIQKHNCIIAHLNYSSSCSDGSIYSWDEAVELWPTPNIRIAISGSYFPTWPLDDVGLWHSEEFTSINGVCVHGRQAFIEYDDLVQAIVAYYQQLYADS